MGRWFVLLVVVALAACGGDDDGVPVSAGTYEGCSQIVAPPALPDGSDPGTGRTNTVAARVASWGAGTNAVDLVRLSDASVDAALQKARDDGRLVTAGDYELAPGAVVGDEVDVPIVVADATQEGCRWTFLIRPRATDEVDAVVDLWAGLLG